MHFGTCPHQDYTHIYYQIGNYIFSSTQTYSCQRCPCRPSLFPPPFSSPYNLILFMPHSLIISLITLYIGGWNHSVLLLSKGCVLLLMPTPSLTCLDIQSCWCVSPWHQILLSSLHASPLHVSSWRILHVISYWDVETRGYTDSWMFPHGILVSAVLGIPGIQLGN